MRLMMVLEVYTSGRAQTVTNMADEINQQVIFY